mgnify:CR=1 FL=1
MCYALNRVKPTPCVTEFEVLNKWEEEALEKERFRPRFRGHWHRWIEENSGWKEKKWRAEMMMDGERIFFGH